jgi:signal transduction histidine kinase/CheY-like chemotaxis protein/HPt (histidine-containing phosphotransfer) domain-containing protein
MKDKNSLITVRVIILVLAASFAALTYWGVKSYLSSSEAIEAIVRTDTDAETINALYKSVIQSDIHLNNFFLSGDSIQWQESRKYFTSTDSLIGVLENDSSDRLLSIDSVRAILTERERITAILYPLKKRQGSEFFTEQALMRIKNQLSDSVYIEKSMSLRQEWLARRDTVERLSIIKTPDRGRGINRLWRWLTGVEKMQIDTLVLQDEKVNYDLQVSVDSSIVRDYFIDSTLKEVQQILGGVLQEEIILQRRLRGVELQLISYNELLVKSIRDLLDDMTASNNQRLEAEKEKAQQKIERAHLQAFVLAGLGILVGFVLLFILIKDLTLSNTYKKQLEEERDRANELARAKEEFLSRMSHEIRTPLHSISGFTALLSEAQLNEVQQEMVRGIANADIYLSQLLNNILEQSKIDAGNFRLQLTELYIPDLCAELGLLFKPQQEDRGTTFNWSYSENLNTLTILTDAVKLKQVLVNLLGNAFKFTSEGQVTLHFKYTPDQENSGELTFIVTDTGLGVDEKYRHALFTPYGRIEQQGNAGLAGTGLGLSISKYIVEHLGGSIGYAPNPERGSTFKVQLPAACKAHEVSSDLAVHNKATALYFDIELVVVEDDRWNARLIANMLQSLVREVRLFEAAEPALDYLKDQNPAEVLVFTDLNLPGADGHWLLEQLQCLAISVVAVSASVNRQNTNELLKRGFRAVLGKPFKRHEIQDVLEACILADKQCQFRPPAICPNWGAIDAFSQDDSQKLAQRQAFTESFEQKVLQLEQALIDADYHELQRMAHQLKAACEQLGINSWSENLQTVELAAQLQQWPRIHAESALLLPKLRALLKQL